MIVKCKIPNFLLLNAHFASQGLSGDCLPINLFSEVDFNILNEPKVKLINKSEFKSHTNDLNPIYKLIKDFKKTRPSRMGVELSYRYLFPPDSGLLTEWSIGIALIIILNKKWNYHLTDEEMEAFISNYPPFCQGIYHKFKLNAYPSPLYVSLMQLCNILIDEGWLKKHLIDNDITYTLGSYFPDLKRAYETLIRQGFAEVGFCGKGPCLYALSDKLIETKVKLRHLNFFYEARACQPVIELID